MTKLFYMFISLLALGVLCPTTSVAGENDWKELKGRHFLVYYRQDKKFAGETLRCAEQYYRRIAEDLGYPRHDRFWLWEKRVRIYVHDTRQEFVKATGAPEWAWAKASHGRMEIAGVRDQCGFLDSALPHEMTHLIFRDFMGFKGEIPLWLDEGIAMREEEGRSTRAWNESRRFASGDKLIPLEELTRMDIRKTDNPDLAVRFYEQSIVLVGYLIEEYGSDRFGKFCRELRDGRSVDDALKAAYPGLIGNMQELEKAWREYLAQKPR